MTTGRMEAFSDGVIAIIITIMVLELKIPHEAGFRDLGPLAPAVLSYVLSLPIHCTAVGWLRPVMALTILLGARLVLASGRTEGPFDS